MSEFILSFQDFFEFPNWLFLWLNELWFLQDLIDMTLRKMDKDRDGKISFSDFQSAVSKEPLMMEAFGPCLPNNQAGSTFASKILESEPNGIVYYTY